MTALKEAPMRLIDLYSLYQSNEITIEQMADVLDITPLQLKLRMGHWKHRLPLFLSLLDKVATNEISRSEAAEALGVGERNFNKVSSNWKIFRPVADTRVKRVKATVKFELRKKFAIDFIGNLASLEEAAERAGCQERQMRRWVSDLLDKHFKMVWADLKTLSDTRRVRLAEEIREAEKLDFDTRAALNSIGRGETTIEEVAVSRAVAAKRAKHLKKARKLEE